MFMEILLIAKSNCFSLAIAPALEKEKKFKASFHAILFLGVEIGRI
jgi:hypothetical protein